MSKKSGNVSWYTHDIRINRTFGHTVQMYFIHVFERENQKLY